MAIRNELIAPELPRKLHTQTRVQNSGFPSNHLALEMRGEICERLFSKLTPICVLFELTESY
jgi:hypothetical protein